MRELQARNAHCALCANYETQVQALQARVKGSEAKWRGAEDELEKERALEEQERDRHANDVSL